MATALPQPEQTLMLDLELPPEALEYLADNGIGPEDVEAPLLRLIFWTGYMRGRADTTATLEREVAACAYMP